MGKLGRALLCCKNGLLEKDRGLLSTTALSSSAGLFSNEAVLVSIDDGLPSNDLFSSDDGLPSNDKGFVCSDCLRGATAGGGPFFTNTECDVGRSCAL